MSIRSEAKRRKNVVSRLQAIRALHPLGENDRHQYSLRDINKTGSYLNFKNKDFVVQGISRYQEMNWKLTKHKDYQTFELELLCLNDGQKDYLEWSIDDVIDVSHTIEEIKFSQIHDKKKRAIDRRDLEQIIDNEESLFFNTREYYYEDDWAAMYYRDQNSDSIRVRFYEFESENGEYLTIEEWIDGPLKDKDTEFEYSVFLSEALESEQIEILQLI